MPDAYDGAALKAEFTWTATTTGTLVWGIKALSLGNDDAIDTAVSATSTISDDVTAGDDLMVSAETSLFTPTGTPAGGENMYVEVCRDTFDGSDTMDAFGRLIQVKMEYGKSQFSDQ